MNDHITKAFSTIESLRVEVAQVQTNINVLKDHPLLADYAEMLEGIKTSLIFEIKNIEGHLNALMSDSFTKH